MYISTLQWNLVYWRNDFNIVYFVMHGKTNQDEDQRSFGAGYMDTFQFGRIEILLRQLILAIH